ncbi:MAG: HAD-IIIA family hydrolase, partial [Aquificaceae bacterium]|nr:HAD-IIIA family hydrolase [Aquificaceae bacterium]
LKDLEEIHNYMTLEIEKAGGRIDGVFFCPHDYEKEACYCRKPNIGLALQAKEVFPDIDFSKSIVVGDSVSDMEFAKRIGAIGIAVGMGEARLSSSFYYRNIWEFVRML